ncbi:MAG TPA: dinitrogenase iron-molybdenum cofactor biosynthesis protein [Nitrospirae bacterium]|nr:feMo cofactor biosynthesis protein NifB [bacterium BMS3Bbin09]HDO25926.1 dinitrogenase iron-molybdenum cofactor biosynthesis protein [Nitrospirota bacterium]
MKIAIATTDGLTVNEHFGKAKKFFIYDATSEKLDLLTEREVEPYATGQKDHTFDKVRFQEVAKVLEGCEKVFITKIGDEPAAALKAMGIEPVVYEGAIKDIDLCRE